MTEMSLTSEKIDKLWDIVKNSPNIIGMLDCSSKDRFAWVLTSSSHVYEYPFGFLRISDIHPQSYALVHGIFWAPSVYKNVDRLRQDALQFITDNGLHYLCIIIPSKVRSLRHLVAMIGFKIGPLLDNYYEIPFGRVDGQVYYLPKED